MHPPINCYGLPHLTIKEDENSAISFPWWLTTSRAAVSQRRRVTGGFSRVLPELDRPKEKEYLCYAPLGATLNHAL